MTPNPNAPVQQPNWFSRNWKWVVPVGCMVPMLCCGGFGAVTYLTVAKFITSSGAFTEAMTEVNTDPQVEAELGIPVTPGFGVAGNLTEKNGMGDANFVVPIEGKKGKGELHVVATGKNGKWTYTVIEVTANGKTIDVLKNAQEDAPQGEEPPDEDDQEPADPEPDGD